MDFLEILSWMMHAKFMRDPFVGRTLTIFQVTLNQIVSRMNPLYRKRVKKSRNQQNTRRLIAGFLSSEETNVSQNV